MHTNLVFFVSHHSNSEGAPNWTLTKNAVVIQTTILLDFCSLSFGLLDVVTYTSTWHSFTLSYIYDICYLLDICVFFKPFKKTKSKINIKLKSILCVNVNNDYGLIYQCIFLNSHKSFIIMYINPAGWKWIYIDTLAPYVAHSGGSLGVHIRTKLQFCTKKSFSRFLSLLISVQTNGGSLMNVNDGPPQLHAIRTNSTFLPFWD